MKTLNYKAKPLSFEAPKNLTFTSPYYKFLYIEVYNRIIDNSVYEPIWDVDDIHNDIDDPAYFRSSVHLRSTPQTTSIDPHDRRFVARPSTPYKCGKITLYV